MSQEPFFVLLVKRQFKSQLKKVGIDVEARVSPDFPTWAERTTHGKHDATVNVVFNWGDPVTGVHRTYITSNIKEGMPYSNTSQYSNPEIDALLEKAGKEMDVEKRKALYAEFQKKIWGNCLNLSSPQKRLAKERVLVSVLPTIL